MSSLNYSSGKKAIKEDFYYILALCLIFLLPFVHLSTLKPNWINAATHIPRDCFHAYIVVPFPCFYVMSLAFPGFLEKLWIFSFHL